MMHVQATHLASRFIRCSLLALFLLGAVISVRAQSPLVRAEYFFDQDPGFGAGNTISVSSALSWNNIPVSINIQSLTTGMHTLNFRAQSQDGNWSFTNRILVYKFPVTATDNRSIQRIEYYFDTDPGFGNGNAISITGGQNNINALATISVENLTAGVHQLFVRARDNQGKWSITQRTLIYKPDAAGTSNTLPAITQAEYFFDNDPGFGNGISFPITTGVQILNQTVQANIDAVSPGIHQLYIRVKNANGHWSLTNRTMFYKPNVGSTNNTLSAIVQAEYFFDTDPGFGKGTAFPITSGIQLLNQTVQADISNIPSGIHQLYIRVKDANGHWSFTNRTMFYKPNVGSSNGVAPNITKAEYFFDTDPGFGSGINIPITPGIQLLNQTVQANTSSLSPGIHHIYFRVRDAAGKWSISQRVLLYKSPAVSPNSLALIRAEYFIDNDPGFGHAIPCPIPGSGSWNDSLMVINVAGLTSGDHKFFIRVQDNRGVWSLTNVQSFTLESTPVNHLITITSTNKRSLCAGDTIKVGYHAVGSFNAGNQFQVELSSTASDFSNPINIGSLTSQSNGVIWAVVPYSVVSGTSYKIRLKSTSPNLTSPVYLPTFTASCISQDPPVIQLVQKQDLTCANLATGSIDIQVSGGNAPYTYVWTKSGSTVFNATTQDLDGLSFGEYLLTVRDSVGTESQLSVYISSPTLLLANAQASTLSCAGTSTGTVSVAVSGGIAPYQYSWNNGNTTASQSSLAAGLYSVAVTDQNGCVVRDTVQLLEPQGMQFQYILANSNCAGTPGGAAQVSVTGGNVPYSYLWSNGSSSAAVNSLLPGRYGIRVTDAVGCIKTDSVTIGFNHPLPLVSITVNGPLDFCQGLSTTLTSSALAGNLWSNGEVGRNLTVTNSGNYTVSIQQNGCVGVSQPVYVNVIPRTTGVFSPIGPIAFGATAPLLPAVSNNGIAGDWTPSVISNTESGVYTFTPAAGECKVSTPIQISVIRVPDLAVQQVQSELVQASANDSVTLTWQIANLGSKSALTQWTEKVYLQSSTGANRILIQQQSINMPGDSLLPSGIRNRLLRFALPAALNVGVQGQFVVEVVAGNDVPELNSMLGNNISVESNPWTISKQLNLLLNASTVLEGNSTGITGLITRSGSIDDSLVVQIQVRYPQRYQIPATLTIPAGQSGRTFSLTAIDNQLVEGSILDTIIITALNYSSTSKAFTCLDNDQPSLTILGLPTELNEGDSMILTIQTNLAPIQPLTVFLTSSNSARFPLPASLIIPAGSTQVSSIIRVAQDQIPELSQTITIQAGASGHNAAITQTVMNDDDVPGLELQIQQRLVSEGAGIYGSQATIRRLPGGNAIGFTVNLAAGVPNALILPSAITLTAQENEKTFWIGVVENQLVDSVRVVPVTASLYVQSCGCNALAGNAGFVSDTIRISDNDGPALQISTSTLTLPEGLANAGLLKVSRNTNTTASLTVQLFSSDTNELRLPITVVIPSGQSFVNVPIATISDGLQDGTKQVTIQARAVGFAPGSLWMLVTDQNKPDLQISSVQLGTVQPITGSLLTYRIRVNNTGFANAVPGLLLRGYWSQDDQLQTSSDSLVIEKTINQSIPFGQAVEVSDVWTVPQRPGPGHLIFQVNGNSFMEELLYTNNQSLPIAFQILPNYTAQVAASKAFYKRGDTIILNGTAIYSNGQVAADKPLDVYVITNGFRRVINTITNDLGQFTTQYIPMTQEAGHYTVGACFPGLNQNTTQDQFDILGVRLNQGNFVQFRAIINDTLTGSFEVENLSQTPLSQFTLTPKHPFPGVQFNFDTISLTANGRASIGYRIIGNRLSNGLNFELFELESISAQGAIHQQTCYYFCQAPNGYLTSDPVEINVAVSQQLGQRTVEVRLFNSGRGNTGTVQVNVPQVSWLSLMTPSIISNIASGDTALVILKFTGNAEVPFDFPIQGNIGINSANGNSFRIPFSFEKTAVSQGAVRLTISNQFTYLTNSAPLVKGAQVTIKNYFSGLVYAQGFSDSDGVFIAGPIPEGTHRVIVEKPNHLPFNGTITVLPGDTLQKDIFINYRAITFSWSVVPTAIQDQYNITLVTTFETHVPMPVVTINIPDTMPALAGTEVFAFNAVMTNHGLITAKDVQLKLPDTDQEYEFISNYIPGDLLAQQSIQVPVIMRRRQDSTSARQNDPTIESISQFLGMSRSAYSNYASRSLGCQDFVEVVYGYTCNLSTGLWETGGALFTYEGRSCSSDGGGGTPPPPSPPGGGGGGTGGNGYTFCALCPGISIGGAGASPVYENENKSCNQCINDIIGAAANCGTGGAAQVVGVASCIAGNIMSDGGALGFIKCIPAPIPPPIQCAQAIIDAINTCSATQFAGGAGEVGAGRSNAVLGAQYVTYARNMQLALKAYGIRERWASLYFGDMINSNSWNILSIYLESFIGEQDSIPSAYQDSILQRMSGYEIQPATIQQFFQKWHASLHAKSLGILQPNAQYPNIIHWNLAKAYSDSILVINDSAIAMGYLSIDDMYQQQRNALEEIIENQNGQAVCASVKVQLSQQLTMTREAFEGTLEIFNGHPTDAMDSITVNISITDINGVPSNGLFEIQTGTLTNLSDVTGTGNISSQGTGKVKFLFIPEIGAAPTAPVLYNFGGSVRYWDPYVREMVTMPLSNVPLTVNPSPNLALHYFMQRNILSDDPLTSPEIEPTIPAELGVLIDNNGYGPAVNVTIESAQPEIIENESGLAIQFQLIGSNFQGQPTQFGVNNILFGTIPAREARVGQWYFTSSLLGKFIDYQSSVVHANSFGNPELSLISGVTLHELTRSIKEYGPSADPIHDFLVNDVFDAQDRPDKIYFSQGKRTADVYPAASGTFNTNVAGPSFTNTLLVRASEAGWNYIKLADPGNGLYELVSVTRNDGQVIPLNNVWLTFVTLPVSRRPVYENKFHFVDLFASTTLPVSYTVVWRPKNLNGPRILRIEGVSQPVTSQPITELSVVFDRPIDPLSVSAADFSLNLQGGPNLLNAGNTSIQILDSIRCVVNISNITTGNGFYRFIAQAAQVADIYGILGLTGKDITWTQFLTVPTVAAYQGIPSSRRDSAFNRIQILFNLPIDSASINDSSFAIHQNGMPLISTLQVDSISSNRKTVYLSELESAITQDGFYDLIVKLTRIQTTTQVFGIADDSIRLQVDRTGPAVDSIIPVYSGGIDPQHIPFIDLVFDEAVSGLNSSALQLTRNGDPISILFNQLVYTSDLKHWRLGNLGLQTYPDGVYTLTISYDAVQDDLGNLRSGVQTYSWTVNRNAGIQITQLSVSPDLGYSTSDGFTSTRNLSVQFKLSDDAQNVAITQVDPGGRAVLRQFSSLDSGLHQYDVLLLSAGQTSLEISGEDANGNRRATTIALFIDEKPLEANWLPTASLLNRNSTVDTMLIRLSNRLLDTVGLMSAISLTRNGMPVSKIGWQLEQITDTLWQLSGLSLNEQRSGQYIIRLNRNDLKKYQTGAKGVGQALIQWEQISANRPPIANAGSDQLITAPGWINLQGSLSSDPDGDSITYTWIVPNGWMISNSAIASPSIYINPNFNGNTFNIILVTNDGQTTSSDVVTIQIQFGNNVVYFSGMDTGYCSSQNPVLLIGNPAGGQFVGPGMSGNTFNPAMAGAGVHTIRYQFNGQEFIQLVRVTEIVKPLFASIAPICSGVNPPNLPQQSLNGVSGTWSPVTVSNTQSGNYVFTPLSGICADTASVFIQVNPNTSSNEIVTRCGSYTWNGQVYSNSGTYSVQLQNARGCDSLAQLQLTIVQTVDSIHTASACDSFFWSRSAKWYRFSQSDTVRVGCLNHILQLTILSKKQSTTAVTICGSALPFMWNGVPRSQAGTYSFTTIGSNGCDSIATLILTVTTVGNSVPASVTQTRVSNVCGNRVFRYTASIVANAQSYRWVIPNSLGGVTGVTVDSGDIETSRVILLRYSSNRAALITDSIRVAARFNCGYSNNRVVRLSATALNPPASPLSITITPVQVNVCGAKIYRYAAPALPVAGSLNTAATGYVWTLVGNLSTSMSLDSGTLNSRVVRIKFTNNAAAQIGDSIKVLYTSECGNSLPRVSRLTNTSLNPPLPPTSFVITPIQTNVCGARIYRYTAPALPLATTTSMAATGYQWTLVGGLSTTATVDSGSLNSRVVRIRFSSNAATQLGDSMKLNYTSGCGNGQAKASKLTNLALNPPLAPASIIITPLQTNVCGARIYRYTAPVLPLASSANGAASGYQWSFSGNLSQTMQIDSGSITSRVIVVRFSSNLSAQVGDSVKLFYSSDCGNSPAKVSRLSNMALNPPLAPTSIVITPIQTNICGARIYRYTAPILSPATASNGAASGYRWSFIGNLSSSMQIDSGSLTSRTLLVRFSSNLAAMAGDSVRVQFTSGCGNSANRSSKLTNTLLSAPLAPASILVRDITTQPCTKKYRYTAPSLTAATTSYGAATGYKWTLPTGSVGSSSMLDSGTLQSRVIVVKYSSAALSVADTMKLQYTSNCGLSLPRSLRLTNLTSSCAINLITSKEITESADRNELDISIYPNPTSNVFQWRLLHANLKDEGVMQAYDGTGNRIKVISFQPGATFTIGADWKPGVYILQFRYADRIKQVKVIKQ
jgi:hypothetical protein